MSLESLKNLITSNAARQLLVTQKHSPKILFVAGTVGVVGATVLACRATLKMNDVLDRHEKNTQDIANSMVDVEAEKQDRMRLQVRTGLEIAKMYAPAIALGGASIAALTGSHVILNKRNGAAMAAYAAVDRAYKQYRENVVSKYGAEDDRKLAAGTERVHIEEKLADGTTKITPADQIKKDSKRGASPYATLFDETSKKFTREPGMNAMIVGMQQSHANDKLRATGHLFLNEVYDMLGLPRTKAGAVVGWVWRRETEEKTGDNYVDFGIFEGDLERAEAFVEGDEDSIWLDFNVDGIILDLI